MQFCDEKKLFVASLATPLVSQYRISSDLFLERLKRYKTTNKRKNTPPYSL